MTTLAAGVVDITPQLGIGLAGFGGVARVATAVESRLEANFAVLESDASRVLLCSVDLIYPGVLREELSRRLGEFGFDAITIFASHTHTSGQPSSRHFRGSVASTTHTSDPPRTGSLPVFGRRSNVPPPIAAT